MHTKNEMKGTLSTPKRTFFILSAVCIGIFIILNLQIAIPLIHSLADADKSLMVALNHDGGPCSDHFWKTISKNIAWVPVGAALLLSLNYYKKSLLIPIFIIVGLALTVTIADQIASSFLKPYFHRFRPSHNEEICNLLHYVGNYRGSKYGFVSSHAANAFGVLAFLAPLFRHKATTLVLFVWACMVSYSRIYLGVHFPLDIIMGALAGTVVGFACYGIYLAGMKYLPASITGKAESAFDNADFIPLIIVLVLTIFFICLFSSRGFVS